jgi:hypothetical protein
LFEIVIVLEDEDGDEDEVEDDEDEILLEIENESVFEEIVLGDLSLILILTGNLVMFVDLIRKGFPLCLNWYLSFVEVNYCGDEHQNQ